MVTKTQTRFASPGTFALRDGRTVTLRPISVADSDGLIDFHGRLSPRTQELRFHRPKPRLARWEAEYLAGVDFVSRAAVVATVIETGPDGEPIERIVADGRIEAGEAAGVGEVGLVVRDDFQGAGLGAALLDVLVDLAPGLGMERLSFFVLSENQAMLGLAARVGAAQVGSDGCAAVLAANLKTASPRQTTTRFGTAGTLKAEITGGER
jgi:RimJ/RimL family protein N-acetyltransferase